MYAILPGTPECSHGEDLKKRERESERGREGGRKGKKTTLYMALAPGMEEWPSYDIFSATFP